MKITLHQLQVFEEVAKWQSVTLAARKLHMTQPAISNIIRQLEEYYQCPLTETISKKLYLTAFGKAVLEGAKRIHENLEEVDDKLQQLKGVVAGHLRVAIVSTTKYFMPHLLGIFRDKYPAVKINMVVCNRAEIINRLGENVDDFVIMSQPPSTIPVDCAEFYEDQLVVAAPFDHPLRKKKDLTLKSLSKEPWIIREQGSGTRIAMLNIMKKHHFTPNIEMEISNTEAVKQAIMARMGISIMSKQSILPELKYKALCELSVKGFPFRHEWYLVKNKGKQLSPIAQNFYEFVIQHQK